MEQKLFDPTDGSVSTEIYASPAIYEQELQSIFGRSWLFLCPSSEVVGTGSFYSTYMGEDPVIVARQKDGSLKVFLNQCRHRGMRVCTADAGVTRAFTCVYHGWVYGLDGGLAGVPHLADAYFNDLDRSRFGLHEAPRVAEYKGLVFANWDPDAVDFTDYLGDMAWYLDAFLDRWDGGLEAIPGVHKWVINTNWKLPSEQFCGDLYHSETTHVSALMALAGDDADPDEVDPFKSLAGYQFSSPMGHGHGFSIVEYPDFAGPVVDRYRVATLPSAEARLGYYRARMRGHGTVFPNFSFLSGYHTVRAWHPRGPGQVEVWAWGLVPKEAPADVRDAWRKSILQTFSPAGYIEQDDGVNLVEIQRILAGRRARQSRFNVAMALGHEQAPVDGFDGPGRVHNSMFAEMAARGFYSRWGELMRAAPGQNESPARLGADSAQGPSR
ncbi:aromatic ring-hydroxylating dioxygenase subunit alpha [Dactylosporangium roseum]|uniref:Aromatic ring-hydroxylating dioxygenase subunit alpha n=1 Tax=Dactylosporangium roseum TaxID=47989 RepID=A0ABY5ZDG6_9ACTN|nr:aromatic ring-hydroxylating dioxygenase subunit alpha [Dactylosporangium roseum]UWZ39709.1 aromatic ring-hydroxylating dioxygenase subunit alpha [Dactylosporangium roseum]